MSENSQLRRGPSKTAAWWKLEGQNTQNVGLFLGWRSLMDITSFGYRKRHCLTPQAPSSMQSFEEIFMNSMRLSSLPVTIRKLKTPSLSQAAPRRDQKNVFVPSSNPAMKTTEAFLGT